MKRSIEHLLLDLLHGISRDYEQGRPSRRLVRLALWRSEDGATVRVKREGEPEDDIDATHAAIV